MALKLRFDPQTITDLREIRAYLLAQTDEGTAEQHKNTIAVG